MYKKIEQIRKERQRIFDGAKSSELRKKNRVKMLTGFSFVLPSIIITAIFVLAATIIGFWLTFRSGSILNNAPSKVNPWERLFTNDYFLKQLKNSFRNTLILTTVSSSASLIISLIITTILNFSNIKGKRIFLTLFFLPQVSAAVASAIIFMNILGPNGFFGLDLDNHKINALWIVIINTTWGSVAGTIIIYNTAFTTIEMSQYESAALDGAGPFRKFFKITIPNLKNILIFTLFTQFIGGLAIFDAPFIMTKVDRSLSLNPYLQTVSFFGYKYVMGLSGVTANVGIGMSILFFLGFIILFLTFIMNKIRPIERGDNK